jgi:hypothetical protein
MSSTVYSKELIDNNDLHQFAEIALNTLTSTPYGRKYEAGLIAIALCQGGANHYVVTKNYARRYFDYHKKGLKDIDIWFFFSKKGFHPMWHRTGDFGPSKFGQNPEELGYSGRRMDFFGRSIPFQTGDTAKSAVQRWLKNGIPKSSPWYLSQKAVVAIFPESITGEVFWVNPDLR